MGQHIPELLEVGNRFRSRSRFNCFEMKLYLDNQARLTRDNHRQERNGLVSYNIRFNVQFHADLSSRITHV